MARQKAEIDQYLLAPAAKKGVNVIDRRLWVSRTLPECDSLFAYLCLIASCKASNVCFQRALFNDLKVVRLIAYSTEVLLPLS